VVFNYEDLGYWKNRTRNYLLSQVRAIWEIVQIRYVIPAMLEKSTHGELQRYENNYKALNLITTTLGRNVYDHVSHLKLIMMFALSFAILMRALIKLSHLVRTLIIGNIKRFLRNLESLEDCFAIFQSIVSNLGTCGPLAYTDNEHAKQFLYALDDYVRGMKITTLEE
jgi:hypothetical protein